MMRRAWRERLPVGVGLLVGAIALATITPAPVGTFWDDAVYLISAKALATGAGYHLVHLPGAPPNVHFPPGYPALLALVWTLRPDFPASVAWFKLLNPLLLGVAAALACRLGTRRLRLPPLVSAAAVLVSAASLPVLVVTGVLFSEPLFLAVLFGALLLAERAAAGGGWRWAVAAGIAAGVLAMVRSAGVVLLPAVVISLLLTRPARWRTEAVFAALAGMAVLLPWQLWTATHAAALTPTLQSSYGPYLEWVLVLYRAHGPSFPLTVAHKNAAALFRSVGIALFPFGARSARPLLVSLVIVTAGFGMVVAGRRARTTALMLAGYFAMVLAWPYAPDRYLWAVWPLVGLMVALGASEAWRRGRLPTARFGGRAMSVLAFALGASVLVDHAAYTVRGLRLGWNDLAARTNAAALMETAGWINANTGRDDIVACDGEPFVHLYTGRTVVPLHIASANEYLAGTSVEQSATDLRALFAANRPRYAVFSVAAGELAAAPLLDGANGTARLERLGSLPGGGAVFRVVLP